MTDSALEKPPIKPYWQVPNRKPTAGIVAAGIVAIAVWAAKEFGQIDIPGDVAAAGTGLISFAVSYLIPEQE